MKFLLSKYLVCEGSEDVAQLTRSITLHSPPPEGTFIILSYVDKTTGEDIPDDNERLGDREVVQAVYVHEGTKEYSLVVQNIKFERYSDLEYVRDWYKTRGWDTEMINGVDVEYIDLGVSELSEPPEALH